MSAGVNRRESLSGNWQGVNWRLYCRCLTGFIMLVVIGYGWLGNSPSGSQAVLGIGVAILVIAASDWLFARRMGFRVGGDGLTLLGPLRQVHVPWSEVQGFRWKEAQRRSLSERFLYVETKQPKPLRLPMDAPVRVPTVTSSLIRSDRGDEADAMSVIEEAWISGRGASTRTRGG